jgi:phosphoribosylglycinamide formyltransferase-1
VGVNLLAALGDRFGTETLADARRDAEARGYRLVHAGVPDARLEAWIDWRFAPSWWSSEAHAGSAWYALRGDTIAGFAAFGARDLPFPWLRGYRGRDDVGIFGPYGVIPEDRGTGIGRALLSAALCSLAERYPAALIPAVNDERLCELYLRRAGAHVVDQFSYDIPRARAVLLASGDGTNVQNVVDGVAAGEIALDVGAVIANDAGAGVLERARTAGVPAEAVVWDRAGERRSAYDARLIAALERYDPELVLLLGWMHLVPQAFLDRFPETLNTHPAFLPFDPRADDVTMPDGTRIPAFRGAHAPRDAFAAGVRWAGVTTHRVTADTDRGAVLVRTPLAFHRDIGSGERLHKLLKHLEYAAVPKAIRRWGFERAARA